MKVEDKDIVLEMYQTAHNLSNHEGDLIWSRFNAFIVVHTIFLIMFYQIFELKNFNFIPVTFKIISASGFLLTFLWLISTVRGYEALDFWNLSARELGDKISKDINLLKKGEEYFDKKRQVSFEMYNGEVKYIQKSCFTRLLRVNTKWTAYFSITIFLLLYLLIFVLSFFPSFFSK